MRIVVDINHPGHVHYFKNFIWEMQKRGHEFLITASQKEVSYQLLDAYGFEYTKLGTYGKSLAEKLINIPLLDIKMYNAVKRFKPDLFLGFGSIRAAHVSKMLGKPCIALDDTEHAKWEHGLYVPFADAILTPTCFRKDFGEKHIRYNGYTELLYLHPNYFLPNPAVLGDAELSKNERYTILRFVSWDANHDVGHYGIRDKLGFVKKLEKYSRVLITTEGKLPPELQPYRIRVSPEKLHDLLYYATLYVGEGGTMASEAAVLGTPSIYVSSLAGTMGNFVELGENYDLLYSFTDSDAVLGQAVEILREPASKKNREAKREKLLKDKIDVTAFMIWFIENYPGSFTEMQEHPEVQYSCASVQSDIS